MHKLLTIIISIVACTFFFGEIFIAHGQSLQLQPAGPQPYKYQPNANYLVPNSPLSSNPNAEPSNNGNVLKEAASGIGGSFLSWIGLKGLGYALTLFGYVAGLIGSTLFTLAGLLVEFGLFLNTTILDSEVVQLGWRFCRDLANLGFTIGIVVIAYATMLGIESYGMKNLIKNFLVAAVLVNFSFSLAGLLIDGSNMMTNFFVTAAIGGGPSQSMSVDTIHKFSLTLADAFGPQRLLRTADAKNNLDAFEAMKNNGGILAAVLSVFFVALFTTFAALGMLAVGLTTFWRFAHLSGLVIIMPLAILCYSFPNTKKHFSTWWQKFSCQLIYMPVATFSLYIVIMFVQIKAKVGLAAGQISADKIMSSFEKAQSGVSSGSTITALSSMAYPFQTIVDMVIVLTMIFLAITKSQKVGCSAGDVAIGWVEGVRDWASGKGFREGRGAYGWGLSKTLSSGMDEKGQNRGNRLMNFMQRIPLISRLTPSVQKITAGTGRRVGNFETEYSNMGDVQLRNALYNEDIKIDAERMASAMKVAVSRGLLDSKDEEKRISQEKFAEFIPALKRYGMDEDILKKTPYLYGTFGWNLKKDGNGDYIDKEKGKKFDSIMKGYKPEEIENLPVEVFSDIEIVKRLSGAQIEKLPKEKEHRAAFSQTLDRLSKEMGAAKFAEHMGKTFNKPETIDVLIPESFKNRLIVKNLTNAHLKKLSGPDKASHRQVLIETIQNPDVFTDVDLREFAKNNFGKSKDIEEIHPEFISNEIFFKNFLNERHVEQINKEPDTKQQIAILTGLQKLYTGIDKGNYSDTAIQEIDKMAGRIITKKQDAQWSTIAEATETKELFAKVEAHYRKRNPAEIPQQKIDQAQKKEKGWWEDDDRGGDASLNAGPPKPPQGPPPTPPAGKSADESTYALAPRSTPQPTQKEIHIRSNMDAALRNTKTTPWNATTEIRDEFPKPTPKPEGTPVTPPEIDALATQEDERLKNESKKIQPPEPIPAALPEKKNPEDNQERGNNTI